MVLLSKSLGLLLTSPKLSLSSQWMKKKKGTGWRRLWACELNPMFKMETKRYTGVVYLRSNSW